jgi:hypothetical protein
MRPLDQASCISSIGKSSFILSKIDFLPHYKNFLDFRFPSCSAFYFYIGCCLIGLFVFSPTKSAAAEFAARLTRVEGKIDYRKVGSINWVDLGEIRNISAGDLLFLRDKATVDLQYLKNGASVKLTEQLLFRVTHRAPIHTKKVHVFGIEKQNVSQNLKKKNSPFQRSMVRNAENVSNKAPDSSESRLQVYRNVSELRLSEPAPGSIFAVTRFPAKLLVKVARVKPDSRYWVFLWGDQDTVTPIWSSYSSGEFYDVSIERPGTYEVQVFNDDETEISDSLKVTYVKADENFKDLGSRLTGLKGDQTVILE